VNRARRILGPAVVPALAIVSAFIVGSIFILITDFTNLQRLGTDIKLAPASETAAAQ